jgi:hypothetical protein
MMEASIFDQNQIDKPRVVPVNGSFESGLFPGLVLKGTEIFRDPRIKVPRKKLRKS